jgi:hypothetical protein
MLSIVPMGFTISREGDGRRNFYARCGPRLPFINLTNKYESEIDFTGFIVYTYKERTEIKISENVRNENEITGIQS